MTALVRSVPTLVAPDVLRAELEAITEPEALAVHEAKAEALRRIAGAFDKSGALAREFAEVRLRTGRRGGQVLERIPKAGHNRQLPTLGSCGIDRHTSSRWQRLAAIPEAEFEAFIAATHERADEVTNAAALKLAKRSNVTPVADDQPPPDESTHTAYPTIVIDPPWRYDNVATRGAAEDHYPTMTLDELAALPIPAAADAHVYLWVTNGFIREGFGLLDAWGFTYKTTLTWCKPQIGMGNWFRNATEHVLFGVRGKQPTRRNDVSTWFVADRTRHSAKPESFYDLVEACSPAPWFEMFSRRKRLGDWHVWGNEATA